MKRIFSTLVLALFNLILPAAAQTSLPVIAVADIDVNEVYPGGINQSIGDITLLELSKLGGYEIMDRYDISYISKRDDLQIQGCYSKICLMEIGKALKAQKILTGSVLTVGNNIVVTFRILDVYNATYEKSHTIEFLKLPTEIKAMIRVTLQELLGQPVDEEMKKKLVMRNDYEGAANNPYKLRLRSDGPRMGLTVAEGDLARRLGESRHTGGFEAQPVMFQFGYQFEKQYLNEGNFQALFEFIPMITGLDQGLFIPSVTFMNGLRNNKNGWEFAFGPSFSLVTHSRGYYDPETKIWTLENDTVPLPQGAELVTRLDSRGEPALQAGFVFAAGKTFKSGRLNIPVNAFVIPSNKGMRFGLSFGFNAKERYAYQH